MLGAWWVDTMTGEDGADDLFEAPPPAILFKSLLSLLQ